jgi:hypothetical protein
LCTRSKLTFEKGETQMNVLAPNFIAENIIRFRLDNKPEQPKNYFVISIVNGVLNLMPV